MPNTREKLIEILEVLFCSATALDIADYLIANGVTLANQVASSSKQLASSEWIPVTERLPNKDGKYLTYYHNHFGDITRVLWFAKDARKVNKYDFHRSWKKVWYEYDSEYGYFTIDDVTHWMPLPEPPMDVTE